jgi:hypothetical protein
VQALKEGDNEKRHEFCGEMFDKTEKKYDYLNNIVVRDKATFHLSSKFVIM